MPAKLKQNTPSMISAELLNAEIKSGKDLECFKRKIAKKYGLPCLKNSNLLKIYHETLSKKRGKASRSAILEGVLRKRPTRSLSGVVNVSVLTKPYPCPGQCIFCPSQKNIPKSYLAKEPAVQRAVINKFNPYQQTYNRLQALQETGHPTDKVELRVIGGTWSYYPKKYQEWFIAECFRACNTYKSKVKSQKSKVQVKIKKLKILQKQNEKAKCRVVGLSVETRPDFINTKELKWLRGLGVTKVELGVQSIHDKVLTLNQRGHSARQTAEATKLLKDFGFKVSYQVMPNLYGSTLQKDIAMFKELFNNPYFKPDYLKIYPLALVKNTKLYSLYLQKEYKPYSRKQLLKLLVLAKKYIPRWCRVERVIRDIPSSNIVEGGASVLNLRESALAELKKQGSACQCIRCREVGNNFNPQEKIFLFRESYKASGGQEIFLSFENKQQTKLYALLRLRLGAKLMPNTSLTPPAIRGAALIRDLHTYGQMARINNPQGVVISQEAQHKGLGKKLLAEAEKISKSAGYKKIAVISSVGVRNYYRKLGYRLQNTYMAKTLA